MSSLSFQIARERRTIGNLRLNEDSRSYRVQIRNLVVPNRIFIQPSSSSSLAENFNLIVPLPPFYSVKTIPFRSNCALQY